MNTRLPRTRRLTMKRRGTWRTLGIRAGIKALSYMVDESRRVAVTVLDQSSFKALDMNMAVDPSAHVLVSPQRLASVRADRG